jgi:D-alanine-D-alanine ligase-like ATP-grasp enzyme
MTESDLEPDARGLDESSDPCGPRLTRADLDAGIELCGHYLLAAQRPDGDFVYEIDWTTGIESYDDNAVRQAGATWGMALLYRETCDPVHRAALDRSLARWEADARTSGGRRWQAHHGAPSGRLGTVALVGLSLLERLAAPEGLANPAATRTSLEALCAFVVDARMSQGGFRGAFDAETGAHNRPADPYSSGEALLLLARSGIELGIGDLVARMVEWADQDYDKFVAKPLEKEPDPDVTKSYYQWGSMTWYALASAGHSPEIWGRRLIDQALWMIDVHRTLERTRNTGYAYEGIVPAWEWANRTNDENNAGKLACVAHLGLRKLCSWQLGHPLARQVLRAAPERYRGAVQNHAKQPALRIDVTQHQLHALTYARQMGIDTAERRWTSQPPGSSVSAPSEYGEPNVYTESDTFPRPDIGPDLKFGLRLVYGLLAQEFAAMGFTVEVIGKLFFVAREQRSCVLFEGGETTFTSVPASRILKDKGYARLLFQRAGVSVADGVAFTAEEKSAALEKVKELSPAVIKPLGGHKGLGTSVNVTAETFESAWSSAAHAAKKIGKLAISSHDILVERFFATGDEARYLVVGGRCVAVLMRLPPKVFGDGSSSIRQLIARENEFRKTNPAYRALGGMIVMDEFRHQILRSQGYSLDSVPAVGAKVIIDWKGGLSTGADSRNITSETHPSLKRVAERAVAVVPGLDIAGVDILAADHSAEARPDNYIVVEANTRPNIGGHQFPLFGRPINVCRLIAENCARNLGFDPEALRTDPGV